MKITLPNPDNMSVKDWFKQMRIVLTSAEKIYDAMDTDKLQELRKSDSEDRNPWVSLRLTGADKFLHTRPNFTLKQDEQLTDYDVKQEVELSIDRL